MTTLLAFDLDGTLTQYKTPLSAVNREILTELSRKYRLVMISGGSCIRIFEQMKRFPIDIIGNYGMQVARYNFRREDIDIVERHVVPYDREETESRITILREKYGFTSYKGDNVYYGSGFIVFPLLGTAASIQDKLIFDPDRQKRRILYEDVCKTFPEYNVFIGGSSSFDIVPRPFQKYYALSKYCREENIPPCEVLFFGDDYGAGGNDESIYLSEIPFVKVDGYEKFPSAVCNANLL